MSSDLFLVLRSFIATKPSKSKSEVRRQLFAWISWHLCLRRDKPQRLAAAPARKLYARYSLRRAGVFLPYALLNIDSVVQKHKIRFDLCRSNDVDENHRCVQIPTWEATDDARSDNFEFVSFLDNFEITGFIIVNLCWFWIWGRFQLRLITILSSQRSIAILCNNF